MKRHLGIILALLPLPLGCSAEDEVGGGNGDEPSLVGIDGVTIQQVAIYQGVKHVLAENGVAVQSNVPLVAGRDGMVRVFYTAAPDKVGTTVVGRLKIGEHPPLEVEGMLVPQSLDHDAGTTINFAFLGDLVGDTFDYRVSLLHEGEDDNPAAHFPVEGVDSRLVEAQQNTLRVMLAPFAYHADGSGRVPDLSPEKVELYRQRLLQLYPVSNVEVTVREPHDWNSQIAPNGDGWQQVGITLFGFRSQDGTAADVYYYGVFNPADSFGAYCGGGCLLGVTLANTDPPDVGNPQLRLALGVGFEEVATDTCAHELGHAHGLMHAPCGPGLDPGSIDGAFPYSDGGIGIWGYDIVDGQLMDPAGYKDLMSYCDPTWISDYHYAALGYRGKHVNLPDYHGATMRPSPQALPPPVDYQLIAIDGQGGGEWQQTVRQQPFTTVGPVAVSLLTKEGHATQVRAHFFRYDHLPGGLLFFPKPALPMSRAELTLDGKFLVIERD